jgi:hypothetical protein
MTVVGLFHHRGGVDKGGKAMLAGQSGPQEPLRGLGGIGSWAGENYCGGQRISWRGFTARSKG